MSSTCLQQVKEIGESMGLKGPELMNFVREQRTRERRRKSRGKEKSKTERRKMSDLS